MLIAVIVILSVTIVEVSRLHNDDDAGKDPKHDEDDGHKEEADHVGGDCDGGAECCDDEEDGSAHDEDADGNEDASVGETLRRTSQLLCG